jgi:hypothetical protein
MGGLYTKWVPGCQLSEDLVGVDFRRPGWSEAGRGWIFPFAVVRVGEKRFEGAFFGVDPGKGKWHLFPYEC